MALYMSGTIDGEFKVWRLEEPVHRVGRSSKNDVAIGESTVSKEHAEVQRRGDRFFLKDLGSRNGTRVNGADAVEPVELHPGDSVEIGHVQLRVTREEPTERVQFNEATVLGPSSVKIRLDQVLERRRDLTGSGGDGALVHLLAEAGRLLVLPRPLKETCDEILSIVEKAIPASRYVLLLQESPEAEPVQIAARTKEGRSDRPLVLSRTILGQVMKENTSVLTTDAQHDPRFAQGVSVVQQAVQSAMAVPLFDDEKVLGVLYVDSKKVMQQFGETTLEILTLLGNMAAVKIKNARLLELEEEQRRMEQELATATQIQRGFLPLKFPEVEGYEIDGFLETCYEVGGDLFDFRIRSDGKFLFLIGDVSGKGMGAAVIMSSFLSSARVLYESCHDMATFADRLSSVMYEQTDPGFFITGIVGCIDPATGHVQYVNAGHMPVCIVGDGTLRQYDSTGVPFGILEGFPYQTEELTLAPGELMAVFSDGIPEAQRGDEFFDEERLHRLLVDHHREPRIEDIRGKVIGAVESYLAGSPRTDDITLVMIRRRG